VLWATACLKLMAACIKRRKHLQNWNKKQVPVGRNFIFTEYFFTIRKKIKKYLTINKIFYKEFRNYEMVS
jgi:hypothetical protein